MKRKRGARARSDPLEHLDIAVGVGERRDPPATDEILNADRLPRPVVDEIDLRQADERRCAVAFAPPSFQEGRGSAPAAARDGKERDPKDAESSNGCDGTAYKYGGGSHFLPFLVGCRKDKRADGLPSKLKNFSKRPPPTSSWASSRGPDTFARESTLSVRVTRLA
jgi:hypothetical protein